MAQRSAEQSARTRLTVDVRPEELEAIKQAAKERDLSTGEFGLSAIRKAMDPTFLTFEVKPEELTAIEQATRQAQLTTQEFFLSAILQVMDPTFRFYTFHSHERQPPPLEDFLKDAYEIVMLGISLRSLHNEKFRGFLEEKIRDAEQRVQMTFLTIDPEIDKKDPVYIVANMRYVVNSFSPDYRDLKAELRETHRALGELYRVGVEERVSVRVLGVNVLPTCGMVITDPYESRSRKMQIAPYLYGAYPNELDPFFMINPQTSEEGRDVDDTFMIYYNRLSQAARLIEFPAEGG